MQALIDFDGWRKWKDFAPAGGAPADAALKLKEKKIKRTSRVSMEGNATPAVPAIAAVTAPTPIADEA